MAKVSEPKSARQQRHLSFQNLPQTSSLFLGRTTQWLTVFLVLLGVVHLSILTFTWLQIRHRTQMSRHIGLLLASSWQTSPLMTTLLCDVTTSQHGVPYVVYPTWSAGIWVCIGSAPRSSERPLTTLWWPIPGTAAKGQDLFDWHGWWARTHFSGLPQTCEPRLGLSCGGGSSSSPWSAPQETAPTHRPGSWQLLLPSTC